MFYIKPLYMLTCSQKPLSLFFWPGLKKICYKYLQHFFFLLDEHSYKPKKGILWTDHIKHETVSEAPSCAIFFLKYSTENAHQTLSS